MANSKKRCRCCKKYSKTEKMYLTPNGGYFCDILCATEYAFSKKEVGKKIKYKAQKKALKDNDRSLRMREAQKAFNAYIRARDFYDDCISCGRTDDEVKKTDGWKVGGAWDCGHFLTVGAFPELRFEESNAHKQCKSCNGGSDKYAKKTNLVAKDYRINLIEKIGLDKVEWLEGPHKPKKYTCEQLKEIELKYKAKLKGE
jgi:hypothetical protein